MEENTFIYYKDVEKTLKNNNFFGFTAKRDKEKNRILYRYKNIRYPNLLVKILTMKLNPNSIPSNNIVLGIKFNDNEIEGWNDFINELKNIKKYHKKSHGNNKKN
jgi:hypothetical protein